MAQQTVTVREIKQLFEKAQVVSITPADFVHEVANSDKTYTRAIDPANEGQKELLMVKFNPDADPKSIGEVSATVHKLRDKEGVSSRKWEGLIKRGYIMIYEPKAIEGLRAMMDTFKLGAINDYADIPKPTSQMSVV